MPVGDRLMGRVVDPLGNPLDDGPPIEADGQVCLDAKLFYEGQKPAVDIGRNMSRVGGKAQPPVLRTLAEPLRLDYAQFLELEVFTRFGGLVDERTRKAVEHGRRMRALLAQRHLSPGAGHE